jgi:hypothetical protein
MQLSQQGAEAADTDGGSLEATNIIAPKRKLRIISLRKTFISSPLVPIHPRMLPSREERKNP